MSTKKEKLGEAQAAAAAADALRKLAESATPETGKPGLPEPEPENDYEDYEEGTDDENQSAGKEVTQKDQKDFTPKDQKDFVALEARITAGKRQAFESLRAIRWRQLWRLILDGQEKQLYSSFDAYCEDRWGHTRQWVTHGTNWLRIMEELEGLGFPVPHLTVKAAQGLLSDRLAEAGGLRAVLDEAKEDGVPLDRDHLREIVVRRADYNYLSKEGYQGNERPAAKTYAEYKMDLVMVNNMGDGPCTHRIIDDAQKLDGNFADNLVSLCQQQRTLPRPNLLMTVLTGKALEEVVGRLKAVISDQAEIDEKKNLLKAKKKELRERLQDNGLKKIREETKKLEQELREKGALKNTNGSPPPTSAGEPPTLSVVSDKEDDDDQEETEPDNDVYFGLDNAHKHLAQALTSEWPADESELNAILLKTQECEDRLAEITAKVKELLADVEQPEAVPNGND